MDEREQQRLEELADRRRPALEIREEMGVDTADYKEVLHWLRMNKEKIIEKFGNIIPEYFRSRIW